MAPLTVRKRLTGGSTPSSHLLARRRDTSAPPRPWLVQPRLDLLLTRIVPARISHPLDARSRTRSPARELAGALEPTRSSRAQLTHTHTRPQPDPKHNRIKTKEEKRRNSPRRFATSEVWAPSVAHDGSSDLRRTWGSVMKELGGNLDRKRRRTAYRKIVHARTGRRGSGGLRRRWGASGLLRLLVVAPRGAWDLLLVARGERREEGGGDGGDGMVATMMLVKW